MHETPVDGVVVVGDRVSVVDQVVTQRARPGKQNPQFGDLQVADLVVSIDVCTGKVNEN